MTRNAPFGSAHGLRPAEAAKTAPRKTRPVPADRPLSSPARRSPPETPSGAFPYLAAASQSAGAAKSPCKAANSRVQPSQIQRHSQPVNAPVRAKPLLRVEAEAAPVLTAQVSERDFMESVIDEARLRGWLVYHTHDSRRSEAGFPDFVMVRGRTVLWVECKRDGQNPTHAQRVWLDALGRAGQMVYVWRPRDREEVSRWLT